MCEIYREKVPTVEALQFDGANGDAVVEFVGGEDYGKVSGDEVVLTPGGKDPRGGKVTVSRGQWVAKSNKGTSVVNEGEFLSKFELAEGGEIPPVEPPPLDEPVPEEELVYQPGFKAPTAEEKPAEGGPEPEKQW